MRISGIWRSRTLTVAMFSAVYRQIIRRGATEIPLLAGKHNVPSQQIRMASGLAKRRLKLRHGVLIVVGGVYGIIYFVNNPPDREGTDYEVSLYKKLPLKSVSRTWGRVMAWDLPTFLREPLLGFYVWMYGVNMQEASDENLKNYKNLSALFRRTLKPNARLVDEVAPVTSPADGTVLRHGKVSKGVVEQVKGVNYAIKAFLGPLPTHAGTDSAAEYLHDHEYHEAMGIKPGYSLYNCIIYLAPGDYHRFHSATSWNIVHRRHFPGELLSVKPQIARWVQGLFNLNERVVYTGTWEHGYFSYTAVGATNVGSIKIYLDPELETNNIKKCPMGVYYDKVLNDSTGHSIPVSKGDMFGEFNLGSTIVLLFEAPNDYEFTVEAGQKVKFGQSLGQFLKGC